MLEIVLVYAVLIFCTIELLFWIVVRFTTSRFKWLITNQDEIPNLSKEGLEKFIQTGYDQELGWVRKPNTSHTENGKYGVTEWNINSRGARVNPDYEELESSISCYGDSFTFSRQVNDNETWEHYLSELLDTNVLNFGVGNHGIDQTLLRLKREYPKNKTKMVIIGVVPETISRILSVWKHYFEYGNTFGFKPRFKVENGNLILIRNPINPSDKFFEYEKCLDEVRKNDFFYDNKFKKEIIKFPFSYTVLKNTKRNLKLIYWVLLIEIKKYFGKDASKIDWNPMEIIMRINLLWRIKLYNDPESTLLLKKIIEDFVDYSKKNDFKAVFVFLPQKDDLKFIKFHFHYYEKFLKEVDKIKGLLHINITPQLIKLENIDDMYSDNNEYGGHFSKEGNKKIATLIYEKLQNPI